MEQNLSKQRIGQAFRSLHLRLSPSKKRALVYCACSLGYDLLFKSQVSLLTNLMNPILWLNLALPLVAPAILIEAIAIFVEFPWAVSAPRQLALLLLLTFPGAILFIPSTNRIAEGGFDKVAENALPPAWIFGLIVAVSHVQEQRPDFKAQDAATESVKSTTIGHEPLTPSHDTYNTFVERNKEVIGASFVFTEMAAISYSALYQISSEYILGQMLVVVWLGILVVFWSVNGVLSLF